MSQKSGNMWIFIAIDFFDAIDFYMIRPTREHKNDSIKKGEKECSNSRKKFCRKINLPLPSTLYLPMLFVSILR